MFRGAADPEAAAGRRPPVVRRDAAPARGRAQARQEVQPRARGPRQRRGHNYLGHNYLGHNYMGHNCIGSERGGGQRLGCWYGGGGVSVSDDRARVHEAVRMDGV